MSAMNSTFHETIKPLPAAKCRTRRASNTRLASPRVLHCKRQFSACSLRNVALDLLKSPSAKKQSGVSSPRLFLRKPPIARRQPGNKGQTRYRAADAELRRLPLLASKAGKPPLHHLCSKENADRSGKGQGKAVLRGLRNCLSPKPAPERTITLNTSANLIEKSTIMDYEMQEEVGKGSYAVVKKAIRKADGKIVAVKIYDKLKLLDPHRKKVVNREIQILKKLSHPNVVKLYDVIDSIKELYLVMEYIQGQTLFSYLKDKADKKLSEAEIKFLFRQILQGLEYCHRSNVAHRDIKLENILVTADRVVKIIDFGFSTCSSPASKSRVFCGTPSYMAPEIVARTHYCGPPADMWALGVLLYIVAMGRYPFKGTNTGELYQRIGRGVFSLSSQVTINCRLLIRRLLQVDPEKRPTCEEVLKDPLLRFNRGATLVVKKEFGLIGDF